jgi:hypothetical protein
MANSNDIVINKVCWLLEEFAEMGKEVVAHFHEWQAAVGLIVSINCYLMYFCP